MMNAWFSSICLLSIVVVCACYGTSTPIFLNNIVAALSLAPVAFVVPISSRRTRTQTNQHHRSHRLFATSNSVGGEEAEEGDDSTITNKCGTGFHAEATTNGEEVCVFDYDDAAVDDVTLEVEVVDDAAFQKQNKARRNFGLPALTPIQFVALQAETKQIIQQQIEDVAANVFREFDQNKDGVISVQELQTGLLKYFGTQYLNPNLVSNGDAIVSKVMAHFDINGDGLLQPDEFVPIDELRTLLMEVIDSDGIEAPPQQQAPVPQQEEQQQQQQQPQGMFQSFFQTIFQDTCHSNADCERPKVCCDFGYKKTCCTGGERQLTPAMAYATIPSSIPASSPQAGGDNVYDKRY